MTLHVAVVGAGAFGGWTALHLRRRGVRVTLVDAWGPGNSRASSGGESRVIRAIYGGNHGHVAMVSRAYALWRESAPWLPGVFRRTGALWTFPGDDAYARSALPLLREAGLSVEELSPADAGRRFPQIAFDGIRSVFYEPEGGYLAARMACQLVQERLVQEGGEYRTVAARVPPSSGAGVSALELSDGSRLAADRFVIACGPWLGQLLPDVIGPLVRPTRQEELFFGLPAGDTRYSDQTMPVWLEHGDPFIYGIPGNDRRGFKVADDTRGPAIDPTTEERLPRSESIDRLRKVLTRRFPGLAGAPLVEVRVCQYEQTPDGDFILDRHPAAENVWIAGGGSGHGFKMGPAVGEYMAALVLGEAEPAPQFAVRRRGLRVRDSGLGEEW